MAGSSISSSSAGVVRVSCNALDTCGANRMIFLAGGLPELETPMASRDHSNFVRTAAFLKESISRDAIIGTNTMFALRNTSEHQHHGTKKTYASRKQGTHIAGAS